jgi:hypothetical protein
MVELRAIERDIARTERIHDQSIAAIEKALEKALQAKERSLKPLRARRQKMESQLQRFGLRFKATLLKGRRNKYFPFPDLGRLWFRKPAAEVVFLAPKEEVIERVLALGLQDQLLQKPRWEPHLTNIKDPRNRARVKRVGLIEIQEPQGDEVLVQPRWRATD